MQQARQTAYKIWISHLLTGKFIQGTGEFDPSYIQINNLNVNRVNIIGTVIETFAKEDLSFMSLLIDDGTAQIVIRAFKDDVKLLQGINIGRVINIIGKPKEYQNEIYIVPEIVREVKDPNLEILRKIELVTQLGQPQRMKQETYQATEKEKQPEVGEELIQEITHRGMQTTEFKRAVANIISIAGDAAINVDGITAALNETQEKVRNAVDELIKEGTIYQDRPGYYKVV